MSCQQTFLKQKPKKSCFSEASEASVFKCMKYNNWMYLKYRVE